MLYLLTDEVNDNNYNYNIFASKHTYLEYYQRQNKTIFDRDDVQLYDNGFPVFKPGSLYHFLNDYGDFDYIELPVSELTDDLIDDKNNFFIYIASIHYDHHFFPSNIHILNDTALNLCRKKRCLIGFDGTFEGESIITSHNSFKTNILDEIYRNAIDNELPLQYVAFFTNNFIAKAQHKKWLKINSVKEKIHVEAILYDLINALRLYNFTDDLWVPYDREHMSHVSIPFDKMIDHKIKNVGKYFLRINRTPKIERDYILGVLINNNALENTLTSQREVCPQENYDRIFRRSKFSPVHHKIVENLSRDKNLKYLPIDIDESDTKNRIEYNADLPFDTVHYVNTIFSIISTSFPERNDSIQLTASVFNPIYFLHPFIIVGHKYTLEALKSYGFKTFGKWIDESYDHIDDMTERMVAVGEEIVKLNNMPKEDIAKMLSEMKDILYHNRNVILNNKEIKKVEDIICKMR